MKSLPDSFANFAIGGDDGANIVQFVGGGYQASVGVGSSQMLEVVFFAITPGWFGIEIGVSAPVNYLRDAFAKAASDFLQHGRPATILDNVVQEGGDGKIFIASGFEHKAGDTQEMRNVGDGRAFAVLAGVFARGKEQRLLEAASKWDDCWALRFHRAASLLHVVDQDHIAVDFAAR